MKKIMFLAVAALLISIPASATVLIVSNPTITPNGPADFTWAYDVFLGPNSRLNPPGTPCTANVPNGICDGLLTIYDFDGYIPGSIMTTAVNWTLGPVQFLGITPINVLPSDDAAILNLSWEYIGQTTVQASPLSALFLGTFSARSTLDTPVNGEYAGRTAFGNQNQRSANLDGTLTPSSVPEPATVLLFGSALLGLAFSARRRLR